MNARHYSDWPHCTAADSRTHGETVGVDLFTDVNSDGEVSTAIYLRFDDGTRWPARTTNRQDVVDAWGRYGPVNDYRTHTKSIVCSQS